MVDYPHVWFDDPEECPHEGSVTCPDCVNIDCGFGEDEITCPYRGGQFSDSWEYADGSGTEKCDNCGKSFTWKRDIEATYWSDREF